jgi:hypothetical protein
MRNCSMFTNHLLIAIVIAGEVQDPYFMHELEL